MHQRFIDAINSDPGDRATQLIYADWLEQQGDPRAEAWRVLIEEGKRPDWDYRKDDWNWWWTRDRFKATCLSSFLHETSVDVYLAVLSPHPTFHAAMDAAAVAWVRCHRDPEFLRESTPV